MSASLGKKFEEIFKRDWSSMPDSFILRLPDQFNGHKYTSSNCSDFVAFACKKLFLAECKEHKGKSFPFSALSQYDKMIQYDNIKDVYPVVFIWLSEIDKVFAVPIWSIKQMIADGKKSLNCNDLDKYQMYDIPSVKKRTFLISDYSNFVKEINRND